MAVETVLHNVRRDVLLIRGKTPFLDRGGGRSECFG